MGVLIGWWLGLVSAGLVGDCADAISPSIAVLGQTRNFWVMAKFF
jgi:hypothetical protein